MDRTSPDQHDPSLISRRDLFRRAGLLSLALLPAGAGILLDPQLAQAAPAFVAYHDRTGANHAMQSDGLRLQSYRMISLSVYGTTANPLYAAVWVQRGGPAWVAIHDATEAQYQSWINTWTAQGYAPTIVSAIGSGTNTIFAAVAEKITGPIPPVRHGLVSGDAKDPGTIQYWHTWARINNHIPRSLAIYGTADSPRYAGVWVPNTGNVAWAADGIFDSAALYQQRVSAHQDHGARPGYVTLSDYQQYASVFFDTSIGSYVTRHNLTSAQYQAEVDTWVGLGYYPIHVQGGGAGVNTRFAALFATQEAVVARTWRVTGTPVASLVAIDSKIKEAMLAANARAAAVAVVRDKRLVYARGYTWAEPSYATTQPASTFRIASCSKPITAIAIMQLVQEGLLSLEDTAQSILQLQPAPGMALDPRFASIKVWQLLNHMGGWDRDLDSDLPDPVKVAVQFGTTLPVTKLQIARYQAGKPLQFTPGTKQVYSNYGYLLLGLIVEKKRGIPYVDAVRKTIFHPLGLSRPTPAIALRSAQPPGAVIQHPSTLDTGRSVLSGIPQPLASAAYGVEDYRYFDSFGGWQVAAVDYAKLLAAFHFGTDNPLLNAQSVQTMWTIRPELTTVPAERPGYTLGWDKAPLGASGAVYSHGGLMPGVRTAIWHRTDGTSIVFFWNTDKWPPDINEVVSTLPATVWPSHNLFSTYEVPAFSAPLINWARGGVATQSSTLYNYTANLAIDGNTDGIFDNGSVTRTLVDYPPWWELDLGAVRSISRIDIYGRADCCSSELQDFYVLISDEPFVSKNLATTRAQRNVTSIYIARPVVQSLPVTVGRTGRYIRIHRNGSGMLSLAEVQVWGSWV